MPENPLKAKRADNEVSVAERVLIATAQAANWTTSPVPYGEIVVRAWRAFPEQFSLPNYPEYPDSSNVHKRLYGPLKGGDLIESLGNKTFRVTELGLTKAKSVVAQMPEKPSSRPRIEVDVYEDATTQWTIEAILDAAGLSTSLVAEGLLDAILHLRFPGMAGSQASGALSSSVQLVVGDTEFKVLIPTTVESLQGWLNSGSQGGKRRLLVRDSVLSAVRCIFKDTEPSTAWANGFESFIGQMVDGMAMFDERRTLEVLETLVKQYNQNLSASMPRIRLKIVERDR